LQAAMVCVKKKVLNPTRFFSLNSDGSVYLVKRNLLRMCVSKPAIIRSPESASTMRVGLMSHKPSINASLSSRLFGRARTRL